MSRKKRAPKKIPITDPKFRSTIIPKLINSIMYDGKKTVAEKIVYDAIEKIKSKTKTIGYAYVSKAPSKTDEFDYLVLLDTDLIVKKAKILVYREDYGGEIGSKRWLQQFIGKTQNDELRYNDTVVAISGATISVRSMTNAMNDLLKSLKILHSKNIL